MAEVETSSPSTAGHGGSGGGGGNGRLVIGCRIGVALGDTWAGTLGRLQVRFVRFCMCMRALECAEDLCECATAKDTVPSLPSLHFTRIRVKCAMLFRLAIFQAFSNFKLHPVPTSSVLLPPAAGICGTQRFRPSHGALVLPIRHDPSPSCNPVPALASN